MLRRLTWGMIGGLTSVAAGWGIADPDIYKDLVEVAYLPGAFSQDVMSIAAGVALLVLALTAKAGRRKLELVAMGLLGYLVYAYGIYVIERVYNWLYLTYMAIFALSFWALVYAVAAVMRRDVHVRLSKRVRLLSAAGALLQPLVFYPLWIGMLIPLMATRQKIETIYAVFILDLCLIMPAFLILAIDAFRGRRLGLLLLPVTYVVGFTLILSLAAAEPAKEVFGSRFDPAAFWPWMVLSVFFLALGALHLGQLQVTEQAPAARITEPAGNEQ